MKILGVATIFVLASVLIASIVDILAEMIEEWEAARAANRHWTDREHVMLMSGSYFRREK